MPAIQSGPATGAELLRRLLQHANAILLESVPHAIVIQPSVVIAQDGNSADPGAKATQLDGVVLRRHESPPMTP
jgi:hypothetical protein